MLDLIQRAGEGVLTLTEDVSEADFLRSRLTRNETRRQMALLADSLLGLPEAARACMPEIDWAIWHTTRVELDRIGPTHDEALWFGARSLVPATLSWLRVYRQERPELFRWG
ncbi:hypothetical protein [Sphaerotilus hippei]|nr:hypothetical protein [Sphaerotilus hippei]